jgi:hypothetical protein
MNLLGDDGHVDVAETLSDNAQPFFVELFKFRAGPQGIADRHPQNSSDSPRLGDSEVKPSNLELELAFHRLE